MHEGTSPSLHATVLDGVGTYLVVRLHLHSESSRAKDDSHAIMHPTDNEGSPWELASAGALNRTSKGNQRLYVE